MKSLLSLSLLVLSLNAFSAPQTASSAKFNQCFKNELQKSLKLVDSQDAKVNAKQLSQGVSACKKAIAEIAKAERAEKKQANKAKRIQKLKDQLAKLSVK